MLAAAVINEQWNLINRYSSLIKLYRITAVCMVACQRFKGIEAQPAVIISSGMLNQAKLFWIKYSQQLAFKEKSK